MLKKYKNKFAEFINNFDFGPVEYDVKFNDSNISEDNIYSSEIKLQIKNSPMFFGIRNANHDWDSFDIEYQKFQPEMPIEIFPDSGWTNFATCLIQIEIWKENELKEYLYEKNQPDLLQFITNKETKKLSFINFEDNSPFDKEEKKLVIQGLNEIKILLKDDFNFSKSQMQIITDKLNNLEEATERLGKTDWKSILIATIFSIISTLALDVNNAEKLLQLFSKVIQNIPKLNF